MRAILLTRGTGGDLLPFVQIGRALKSRGHAVTLMTHAYYEEKVKSAALEFAAIDQVDDFIGLRNQTPTLRVQDFMAGLEQGLPSLLDGYERHKSLFSAKDSLLLANQHTHLGAQCISERHGGIPTVSLFIAPHFVTNMPFWEQAYVLASDRLNGIRAEMGLPAVQDWSSWWRGLSGYIGIWPEWFAQADVSWPVDVKAIGFVLSETLDADLPAEVEQILSSPLPTVLITHATSATNHTQFFPLSIEACQELGWQVIVVTPYREMVPDPLPPNVYYYPALPFRCLLPRLKAIIHHGGIGTLADALAAGIPQLILGAGFDRPDNGTRAQRLGVAEFIPMPQWRVDTIRQALQRLTGSPLVARQCEKLSERVLADTPMETACRYLEEVAASASSSPRRVDPSPAAPSDALGRLSDEEKTLLVTKLRQKKLAA